MNPSVSKRRTPKPVKGNIVTKILEGERYFMQIENSFIPRAVVQYDLEENFIREWDCMKDVKDLFGYDTSLIGKVCKGIFKQAYGFIWRYKKLELKLK